jgi:hypothetical protein
MVSFPHRIIAHIAEGRLAGAGTCRGPCHVASAYGLGVWQHASSMSLRCGLGCQHCMKNGRSDNVDHTGIYKHLTAARHFSQHGAV